MANKAMSLWLYLKLGKTWRYCKPVWSRNGRLQPHIAIVKGQPEHHPEGKYYLHYYEYSKEHWKPVSSDPFEAVTALNYEKSLRDAVKAGVKVQEAEAPKLPLTLAVKSYLRELKLTTSPRTYELHAYTLKLFQAFNDHWRDRYQIPARNRMESYRGMSAEEREFVQDITRLDCLSFREYLIKAHRNSPRSCANKLQRVNQFIKTVLKLKAGEGPITVKDCNTGVIKKEPEVYTPEELTGFFKACTPVHELIFKTFLQSGMREEELKYLYWSDVDFANGTLRVTAKPEFGYAIKDHEERTITVPVGLIEKLEEHRKTNPHKLVFCTRTGRPLTHLWDMCKAIAAKGKVTCKETADYCPGCWKRPKKCERWFLHKFRATYATELLRQGYDIASVRKQLGHKPGSEATFRYLAPLHGAGLRDKGIDTLFATV